MYLNLVNMEDKKKIHMFEPWEDGGRGEIHLNLKKKGGKHIFEF